MLISSYTTICFLVKIFFFFFESLYFSEYNIRMIIFFFAWEIGHPLNMYATGEMEGSHQKCVQLRTGGEEYHALFTHTHLHYLFSCFCLIVSCFICKNWTLISFKKGVFVRDNIFANEISFCCHEISFFYLKLVFRTKVSKKGFNFNQIESWVYSLS